MDISQRVTITYTEFLQRYALDRIRQVPAYDIAQNIAVIKIQYFRLHFFDLLRVGSSFHFPIGNKPYYIFTTRRRRIQRYSADKIIISAKYMIRSCIRGLGQSIFPAFEVKPRFFGRDILKPIKLRRLHRVASLIAKERPV